MITINYDIAMIAGADAGGRNMREHSRTKWNADDWNVASKTTNELLGYKEEQRPCITGRYEFGRK